VTRLIGFWSFLQAFLSILNSYIQSSLLMYF
jgi:hypothetical protein